MRKMKVLTLLALCFVLVFSLAACGTSGNSGNTPNTSNTGNEGAANEPAGEEQSAQQEEEINLGGRSIKISAWWDLTPVGDSAGDRARRDKIAELEEKYNMKLEFVNVPYDDYVDKFTTTVLAGDPFADIVRMEVKWALPAILNKQILPISEFTTSFSDITNEQKLMQKLPPIGGDEYGFIQPWTGGAGIHYNKELFEELGLEDLQAIYKRGEWNWEKFLEIAKKATRDTDNDGKTDVWGYSGWAAVLVRHLAVTNGAKVADDGTGKEGLTDPRTIQALELVNRMYNVDNVVYVKSGNKTEWTERDVYVDGKSAMFAANDWQMADTPFSFGIVPFPIGPEGSPGYTYSDEGAHAYFIPKGVQDPQIVYQIFEELEMIPPLEDYPSQNWLEERYQTQEDLDLLIEHITGTGLVVLDGAYPDYPFNTVVEEIIAQNNSVTATVEKYRQQAQDSMDQLGKN